MKRKSNEFEFSGISPFSFMIHYSESNDMSDTVNLDSHSHDECEIYINISGDVSFMVENRIYPIKPGSVIITRPNEFHHCIYNSEKTDHRHFWILFSSHGNEGLLDLFFNRPTGSGNLISLSADKLKTVNELCTSLTNEKNGSLSCHLSFWRLIELLTTCDIQRILDIDSSLPNDVVFALNFIQTNLSSPITINQIARAAHVSVNTLERHFSAAVNMAPSEFVKKRRLALSQSLLRDGKSVQEAAAESGFTDYSRFIAVFKEAFGITPLQYKKS